MQRRALSYLCASHFLEELVDVGSESLQVVEEHAHLQESRDSQMINLLCTLLTILKSPEYSGMVTDILST